jgi:hypothetical protein
VCTVNWFKLPGPVTWHPTEGVTWGDERLRTPRYDITRIFRHYLLGVLARVEFIERGLRDFWKFMQVHSVEELRLVATSGLGLS